MNSCPTNRFLSTIIVMDFNTFEDVTAYLDSFSYSDKAKAPGFLRGARVERMYLLLSHLGHPERDYKTIHIAGSKGKGSTALYISTLLKSANVKCGLYLSPHLRDYRERFTLSGSFFPTDFLIECARELKEKIDSFSLPPSLGSSKPSTFEMYTLYAYLLFSRSHCEQAVIETGIGGRLDATNTISSYAEVLTAVELEHRELLGNTIREIAIEKSKIIKPFSTVFIGKERGDAKEVFIKEAKEMNASYFTLDNELLNYQTKTTEKGEECTINFKDGSSYSLTLSMRGEVQVQNAALAILCAKKLGFFNGEESLRAIEKATLPGRFEMHSLKNKTVVLDVAHTKSSMDNTISSFNELFKEKKSRVCIFGAVAGKDTKGMLSSILSSFDNVIISKPGSFKKSNIEEIYKAACDLKRKEQSIFLLEDAAPAFAKALTLGSAILIAGSFYLAANFDEVIDGYKCK